MKFKKKYHCVKQHDITDCGVACIATIALQYDLDLSIAKIREYAGTDADGTSALGVVKAAEKLGFTAKAIKVTKATLFDKKIMFPAIANVTIESSYGNLLHYVVIHEVNENYIIIADPAEGIQKYTHEKFYEIWNHILILMIPTESFIGGIHKQSNFQRIKPILLSNKKIFIFIFLLSIVFISLGILSSFYFQILIDDVLAKGLRNKLHLISLGMIALIICQVLSNAIRNHLLLYFTQKIELNLAIQYYKHVLKLPMNFFESRKTGEILSRMTDVQRIKNSVAESTISLLIDLLMVIFSVVILFIINKILFVVSLIIVPFYLLLVQSFKNIYTKLNKKEMKHSAELESQLIESINGMSTIKAFAAEQKAIYTTETKFRKLLKTTFELGFKTNIQSSLDISLKMIGEVVILWVGGIQVLKGNMTVGELITFNTLLIYFLDPLQNLIKLQPTIQEGLVATERLWEILDLDVEEIENETRKNIYKFKGDIVFKDITFRYGTRKTILQNFSLNIKAGRKVALVGESGSGKSTIAKLILSYYNIENGEILIDGHNIHDIAKKNLRENIAYVPQDVFIFNGSIKENITMNNPSITMEKVIEVAKKARLHNYISQLELGYETMIGEYGATLSGGQKQRLAIARAILKNPDILILDEATSNLDTVTEKDIQETLWAISENITTIIIAHRLSTIVRCDEIFVMKDGKVIENGNHENLMKQKGSYYEMWNCQVPL
ncbi:MULTISPECIES: peptidase domain-containing ABC transporter [Priestia]|uniref:peptidase domain-containing ABC transporter n=1 Tax=Priestia TaxID=2800373 RepID=UPI00232B982B|nr:peptidase domain-containing ABC transporter [Priestia sp. AB]MDC0706646.1 peptidase domain-containing ABC transporter [Priestia sp. AB]